MTIIKSYIVTNAAASQSGGSGSVTSFSSGNLSPIFTTSVATPTTTPALTFSAVNQNANLVFAGPATGAAAAPTFRALVAADMPSGFLSGHVIENSGTPLTQRANLNFSNGLTASDNTPDTDVKLGGTFVNLILSGTTIATSFEVASSGNFQIWTTTGNPTITLGLRNDGSGPGLFFYGDNNAALESFQIRAEWLDAGGWNFDFKHGSAVWTRGTGNTALPAYAADYSTNYTDRSWVDRGYVLGAKTYTGTQTFLSSGLELSNPANTFQYIFAGAAIGADRTVTMPLLLGNDVFVTADFVQTLTNKTISGASNTITNVSLTTGVTGILPPANGGTGIANNAASTLTISGNFATTLTVTGATSLTLPTSGTLATLSDLPINYVKTTPQSVTGTTAETKLDSIEIPAGTIQDGDILEFWVFFTKTGTNGGFIAQINVNTSDSLTTDTTVASISPGNTILTAGLERRMMIESQVSQRILITTGNFNSDALNNASAHTNLVTDYTIQQFFTISVANSSALDTTTLRGWYIKIIRQS